MSTRSSEQARKGLAASVVGRIKEVAGAVTGNDSLATEGQLQQAEAAARKEASATEALAGVRADEAAEALQREQAIAQAKTRSAEGAAAAHEAQVRQQAAVDQAQVSVTAERQLQVERAEVAARAERQLSEEAAQIRFQQTALAHDAQAVQARHDEQQASAAAAGQAAARARAEADRLATQADPHRLNPLPINSKELHP